jgi:hypothetical protein
MTVALTQTRVRPDDTTYEIVMVGINYQANRVIVRIQFTNGDTQDIVYEGTRLTQLRNRVSQFQGLKPALEVDIAVNEPNLGGVAS